MMSFEPFKSRKKDYLKHGLVSIEKITKDIEAVILGM
jgi:hypothetical protein